VNLFSPYIAEWFLRVRPRPGGAFPNRRSFLVSKTHLALKVAAPNLFTNISMVATSPGEEEETRPFSTLSGIECRSIRKTIRQQQKFSLQKKPWLGIAKFLDAATSLYYK
jgi:hypothetical protein